MAIRGLGTVDHFGITVPDLDAALEFFVEVLGAELWTREGPFDAAGNEMWDQMRVHPRSVEHLATLRLGPEATIELLEFRRDGESHGEAPPVSHHSVAHLAFGVEDIERVAAELRAVAGVEVLEGPVTVGEGPVKGLRWIYFIAPWGLKMELIQPPPGGYSIDGQTAA